MKKALVVGSGAGGSAAAYELSKAFDVTVLEAGTTFEPLKLNLDTFEPLRTRGLFLDERMIQALFPAMRILKAEDGLVHVNGKCVGGTTTLATGNGVRCDEYMGKAGIDLHAEYEMLENLIPLTYEHVNKWSDLTVRLYMAFEELGFSPHVTPKLMSDPHKCSACGKCVLGCRNNAKWTADKLIVGNPNVSLRTRATVERLFIENGKAKGVIAKTASGKRETLEADIVVLAAGGLNTPVILNASGITTVPALFVDPVICVAAQLVNAKLDRQIPMPFVSQRDEYILSPYFDWLSFFFNKQWRARSQDIVSIMVKFADSPIGYYDGKKLHKPLTAHDTLVIKRSVEEATAVLEHMGIAKDKTFLGTVNAGHPGGCLPLTQEDAQTMHADCLPENVYVADASLIPASMGNPPIMTIMALSLRVAQAAIRTWA